jgi:copper resistance protein C
MQLKGLQPKAGCILNFGTSYALMGAMALLVACLANVGSASAHVYLDHANPAVDSSVRSSPQVIRLWFTGRIQGAFSRITVTDHENQRVDLDNASLPSSDGTELDIGLKSLPAGVYGVHWHVLAIDGHSTEGGFTFKVNEPR